MCRKVRHFFAFVLKYFGIKLNMDQRPEEKVLRVLPLLIQIYMEAECGEANKEKPIRLPGGASVVPSDKSVSGVLSVVSKCYEN
jgi:hypothetical protein